MFCRKYLLLAAILALMLVVMSTAICAAAPSTACNVAIAAEQGIQAAPSPITNMQADLKTAKTNAEIFQFSTADAAESVTTYQMAYIGTVTTNDATYAACVTLGTADTGRRGELNAASLAAGVATSNSYSVDPNEATAAVTTRSWGTSLTDFKNAATYHNTFKVTYLAEYGVITTKTDLPWWRTNTVRNRTS